MQEVVEFGPAEHRDLCGLGRVARDSLCRRGRITRDRLGRCRRSRLRFLPAHLLLRLVLLVLFRLSAKDLAYDLGSRRECHVFGDTLLHEWFDDELFEGHPRPYGFRCVDGLEAVLAVEDPPVALQTLRRDSRADGTAERHAFGKARIIAVQE